MTALATIERIRELRPIPGADRILHAQVLNYWTVVKKEEFNVGDLCVWINPDTTVPRKEWNKFLWPKNDQDPNGERIRIRTCKFKGQPSMGLCLPTLHFFPPIDLELEEGHDITEIIGVEKYEKPIPAALAGQIRGHFPSFLKKTDELNLRSQRDGVSDFMGKECYITLKYDGSSATFYHRNGEFGVCSRNLDLKPEDNNAFWKIALENDLENKLKNHGKNLAVQGELHGPGVNGNKVGIDKLKLKLFNLFDIDEQKYCNYEELKNFCLQFNLEMVDVIWSGQFNFTVDDLVKLSNNTKYPETGNICEGIVIRPIIETYSNQLKGRLSGKIISEEFAAKYGE